MNNLNSELRNALKLILEERTRKNQAYSLRALARDLGLNSGTLSKLLRDDRKLSISSAKSILMAQIANSSRSSKLNYLVIQLLLQQQLEPIINLLEEARNIDHSGVMEKLYEKIATHPLALMDPNGR